MDSALPSLNRKPDDDPLHVGADRRVRPQLRKYKNSPAVLIPTGLLYQIKTKNLIGDELSPRLRFSDTEIPLNQFLRLSVAYFVQDLL